MLPLGFGRRGSGAQQPVIPMQAPPGGGGFKPVVMAGVRGGGIAFRFGGPRDEGVKMRTEILGPLGILISHQFQPFSRASRKSK